MAVIRPFKAIRPAPDKADKVAALPYDVMDSDEAREMVKGNPYSFLHVDKAEIDLDPSIDLYDAKVYAKAKENLDQMRKDGVFIEDQKPSLYIYKQVMDGRTQIGLVGCASIDEYQKSIIKKHELTRADKEEDRVRHVDTLNANTGPIFLTYRHDSDINAIVDKVMKAGKPVYDFVSDDGIGHTVWVVSDDADIKTIVDRMGAIDYLYIADGHHRCASGCRVGQKRREQNPGFTGNEEFNFFLAVYFPDDQLYIMDYNRVVKDLNGNSKDEFMKKVGDKFDIEEYKGAGQCKPTSKHSYGMYLDKKWYLITAKKGTFDEANPVDRLDVSILQNNLLQPILGIEDPRTDKRIDFVGGIRGLDELERRVDGGMAVAFSMFATTIDDLMDIADAGEIMPPKSTWFEPKLRSGLFIHELA